MDTTQESKPLINDVSDTALWVATYRAVETKRPDALFQDPYAEKLSGEKGRRIAASMKESTRYTQWAVVIRTYIIDRYIQKLIAEGVDTVVNLGAGLDSRPYRLNLPAELRWIEVDYPSIIDHKTKILANDTPKCKLERIAMDLIPCGPRRQMLSNINAQSKKVLVLTEGVVPYLPLEQAANLAGDLLDQNHFQYWIVEYFSPKIYKYMQDKKRQQQMKNAPVVFFPEDWFGFFKKNGWVPREIQYNSVVSEEVGRVPPMPWFAKILRVVMPKEARKEMMKFTGYVLLTPERSQ